MGMWCQVASGYHTLTCFTCQTQVHWVSCQAQLTVGITSFELWGCISPWVWILNSPRSECMKAPDLQTGLLINIQSPNTALASQQRLSAHTQTVKKKGLGPLRTAVCLKKLDQSELWSILHLAFQSDMDNLLPQINTYFHVSYSRVFEAYSFISEM